MTTTATSTQLDTADTAGGSRDDRQPAPIELAREDPGERAGHAHSVPPARTDPGGDRVIRSWPLLLLAVPAAIAVWSGWVGIGEMTGFGRDHPLPGIWGTFHINTAVTLPFGVEAYAAYALRAWLSPSSRISARTRTFARRSAIGSLLLGMAGQIAYHLLIQAHTTHAPWAITTAVSCLPVLVLGMGAGLAHLLRADAHTTTTTSATRPSGPSGRAVLHWAPGRVAEVQAAATHLSAAGRRISRRALRDCGIRGSNADLSALARLAKLPDRAASEGEHP